jgi:hypothetical protein
LVDVAVDTDGSADGNVYRPSPYTRPYRHPPSNADEIHAPSVANRYPIALAQHAGRRLTDIYTYADAHVNTCACYPFFDSTADGCANHYSGAHPRADLYAGAVADRQANQHRLAGADLDPDEKTDPHTSAAAHSDIDPHSRTIANPHGSPVADLYSEAHPNTDPHTGAIADPQANRHRPAGADPDPDEKTDQHAAAAAYPNTDQHACAVADSQADEYGVADADASADHKADRYALAAGLESAQTSLPFIEKADLERPSPHDRAITAQDRLSLAHSTLACSLHDPHTDGGPTASGGGTDTLSTNLDRSSEPHADPREECDALSPADRYPGTIDRHADTRTADSHAHGPVHTPCRLAGLCHSGRRQSHRHRPKVWNQRRDTENAQLHRQCEPDLCRARDLCPCAPYAQRYGHAHHASHAATGDGYSDTDSCSNRIADVDQDIYGAL